MSEIDLSSPLNYGTPGSLSSVHTPQSGIRGTPIRMRPDIRTDRRIRQVNVNSDPVCLHDIHNIIITQLERHVMLFGSKIEGEIHIQFFSFFFFSCPLTHWHTTFYNTWGTYKY